MAQTTLGFGIGMILLGVISYVVTGQESVTALIPTFFGIVFVILGLRDAGRGQGQARRPRRSALLAVLGLLGSARGVPGVLRADRWGRGRATSRRGGPDRDGSGLRSVHFARREVVPGRPEGPRSRPDQRFGRGSSAWSGGRLDTRGGVFLPLGAGSGGLERCRPCRWRAPCGSKDSLFLGSSMVEHAAVNRRVVGSSPTRGALAAWGSSANSQRRPSAPLSLEGGVVLCGGVVVG